MHDRPVVLANYIDAKLDVVIRAQWMGLRLDTLKAETDTVDEGAVGRLDVLDPYLAAKHISPARDSRASETALPCQHPPKSPRAVWREPWCR